MFGKKMENKNTENLEKEALTEEETMAVSGSGLETEVSENTRDDEIELDEDFFDMEEEENTPPKKKKLPVWMIIPAVAVIGLACWAINGTAKKTDTTTELSTTKVEQEDIKETYSVSGTVESGKTKVYYSPVNAPILTLNAKVGTTVKAGDVLVSFDTTNLERDNQKSQMQEQLTRLGNQDTLNQAARAQEKEAQMKAEAQATAQDAANAQKQAAIDAYNAVIDQQNALVDGLNAARTAAEQENIENQENSPAATKAQEQIQENNSQIEIDNARIAIIQQYTEMGEDAYEKSEARKTEKKTFAQLKEESDNLTSDVNQRTIDNRTQQKIVDEHPLSSAANEAYTALQAQYDELGAQIAAAADVMNNISTDVPADNGTTSSAISSEQIQTMQINEDLAAMTTYTAEELVQKGRDGMRAEFDSIVADVKAAAGTDAVQGGEMYTLASLNDMYVTLGVPTADFDKVKTGQGAVITLGDEEYKGTVDSVSQIATANEKGVSTIAARVKITNANGGIIIGVPAKVVISVAEEKNTLVLPNDVVNTNTKGDFVYVIENGTVLEKSVEIGITSDSKIQILKGLEKGDEVVSDTSGNVSEGMKAKAKAASK